MKSEFDVTLTVEDMYRFSMYHTYSGVHGIASVIIAVLVFFVAAKTYGDVELMYTLLYILFGVHALQPVPAGKTPDRILRGFSKAFALYGDRGEDHFLTERGDGGFALGADL